MIRALLVDDEEPARDRLRGLLAEFADVCVIDEAGDGAEAIEKIERTRPDLVFLDIQMPGLTGMEVAASLTPPRPQIVFCTAFDRYAIDAFEHHAADYLLKPVVRRRLAGALQRIRDVRPGLVDTGELREAVRTQARLLPQTLPAMPHLDYAGLCRPARAVGGDYYDFLSLGAGLLGLVLGDVSGKGLFAGLLVAGLQARIQSLAPRHAADPGALVAAANRELSGALESNRYATLFYGRYHDDSRTLRYVNAGHLPPLVLRNRGSAGEEVIRLEAGGPAIGVLPDAVYDTGEVRLAPGDLLLAYTDGVTEARDSGDREYGETRLISALRDPARLSAEEIAAGIRDDVDRFAGSAAPHDDLTLLVARVR